MQIDQWTSFLVSIANDAESAAILRSGDVAKIVALAQSKGFSFTGTDIEDAKLNAGELGQEALEGVSGGIIGWPRLGSIR